MGGTNGVGNAGSASPSQFGQANAWAGTQPQGGGMSGAPMMGGGGQSKGQGMGGPMQGGATSPGGIGSSNPMGGLTPINGGPAQPQGSPSGIDPMQAYPESNRRFQCGRWCANGGIRIAAVEFKRSQSDPDRTAG